MMCRFSLLLLLLLASITVIKATFYPPDDSRFTYVGRWHQTNDENGNIATADWPCSSVVFGVSTATTESSTITIALRLNLQRLRVAVVIRDSSRILNTTIIEGNTIDFERNYDIVINDNSSAASSMNYTVSIVKLTQATPYGPGAGRLLTSVLEFHGIELGQDDDNDNVSMLLVAQQQQQQQQQQDHHKRMAFIGASDTAGFCVDGSINDTSDALLHPWKYDNCFYAAPSLLATRWNATSSFHVTAIAGIGVSQNAFADRPVLLGELTMPDYYNRTLQTNHQLIWNFTAWRPDVFIISLGGNDYNHQVNVPSNETFNTAYEEFLLQIIEPYLSTNTMPTIISICGQGDPTEIVRDPNNDRCRPCDHVQDATVSFQNKYDMIPTYFIFIPCDGSVVTGVDDIGCDGHKNRIGQERVADFLEPKIREIMGWSDDEAGPTSEPMPSSGGSTVTVRWLKRLSSSFVGLS